MEKFAKAFHSQRASIPIVDFLADELPISKAKIKDAMQKGAVWLNRKGLEPQPVRRAKDTVKLNDEIHIYFDEDFLAIKLPPLRCVESNKQFSVWIKPEGIMQELSLYGDHLTLARLIERDLPKDVDCYFVDPANGEITGLVVIAHTPEFGKILEEQLAEDTISKDYRLGVRAKLEGDEQLQVDGKAYPVTLLKYTAYNNTSFIRINNAQHIESTLVELLQQNGLPPLEDEQLQCCSITIQHPANQKSLNFHL